MDPLQSVQSGVHPAAAPEHTEPSIHPLDVHRQHHALVAVALGRLVDQVRSLDGPGIDRDLVRPAGQHPLKVLQAADAAPHGQGNEDGGGHIRQNIGEQLPPLHRGGDVVKDQLVGPGPGVVVRQTYRVRDVLDIQEVDPLHHPSVPYIQTGDDPFGHHLSFHLLQGPVQLQRPGVQSFAQDRAIQTDLLQLL